MQIAAGVPFERSARLSPRHRPGLPRRRRPAYRVLTVIPVSVLASAVIIVTGTDLAAPCARSWARMASRSKAPHGSTPASPSQHPSRTTAASRADVTRCLHSHPPVSSSESAPSAARTAQPCFPTTPSTTFVVGTATIGDWTERAVLIAGRIEGRPVEFGIVPVDESSLLISPATDAAYRALLGRLIACAKSAPWSQHRSTDIALRTRARPRSLSPPPGAGWKPRDDAIRPSRGIRTSIRVTSSGATGSRNDRDVAICGCGAPSTRESCRPSRSKAASRNGGGTVEVVGGSA